ncbi:MAG: AtpZ/AtpI family protein [Deltaproteobacteria bacterium]|nr:AtpZ/AtpI family protein [Deltaproteobacteria bacterium]
MNDRQDRKAFYRELGRYSALGFEMSLSVLIGLGIGYYLDKWLGTAPWLMILWLGFGFAAGVRSLFRAARRSEKELEQQEKDEKGRGNRGGD